jgi:glycosyltransferase involved in cell wall biosynthesis
MKVSIIIPHYNDRDNLQTCLKALDQLRPRPHEIIVVDDGSDIDLHLPDSSDIIFHKNTKQSGPGITRNIGANKATGDLLLFVDSDVEVNNSAYTKLIEVFQNDKNLAAAFGSYDDTPLHKNLISQYTNLRHHYYHQASSQNVSTFWTGFGAVKAKDFDSIKGFSLTLKSLEDIELGVRLSTAGYHIKLVPEAMVKHLKRWSLGSLLRTDIFDRAIPWSNLLATNPHYGNTLNACYNERLIALYAVLIPVFFIFSVFLHPLFITVFIVSLVAFLFANAEFFKLIYKQNDWHTGFCCILLHWLYYIYCSVTFTCVLLRSKLTRLLHGLVRLT